MAEGADVQVGSLQRTSVFSNSSAPSTHSRITPSVAAKVEFSVTWYSMWYQRPGCSVVICVFWNVPLPSASG